MKGLMNTWLPEKQYGFIKGEDGKDYFVHARDFRNKSQIALLAEALPIEFDPQATPKGYRARKCRLLNPEADIRYIEPEHFMTSRNDHIRGWEIIESGAWQVSAASAASPDDAKERTIALAQKAGANALLHLSYGKSTGSEPSENGKGTHHYTIHHFSGVLTTLGKRHANGKLSRKDLAGLNERAAKIHEQWHEEHSRLMLFALAGAVLLIAMGLLSFNAFRDANWIVGIICGVIALIGWFLITDYFDHKLWITPCAPQKDSPHDG